MYLPYIVGSGMSVQTLVAKEITGWWSVAARAALGSVSPGGTPSQRNPDNLLSVRMGPTVWNRRMCSVDNQTKVTKGKCTKCDVEVFI